MNPTCYDLQHTRCILHTGSHGPYNIQRRGVGDEAIPRHPPIAGLEAHHTTEVGGLPDAAAGV